MYTNDGIITQNIFNAAVSTSVKLKTNTKKLHFCEYLISTWCLLHPGYQIWLFRDNLTGIQWVKRMYVWSVKVGMNLSVIWTIVTFLHTRGPGSKSVWVATSYRSCFWKCTVQASLWYAALDRGGGLKEVKSARGIEAFYMYFNGTGNWGGETMSMQKAIQVFLV